ncbi:MAG: hypothetical protein KDK26_00160, partial [Roseivivax sp.]|nr:hypothetical protein [Roseivivax sp.]
MIEEIGNSIATGTTIEAGNTFSSAIDYDGDVDFFAHDFAVGYGYLVFLDVKDGLAGHVRLYADDGQRLLTSVPVHGLNTPWFLPFTPNRSDIGFVEVFPNGTGRYDLTVVRELANDISTATQLDIGSSLYSTQEHWRDADFVSVSFQQGQTYILDLAFDGGPFFPSSAVLTIFDQSGLEIQTDSSGSGHESILYTASATGTHYVSVGQNSQVPTPLLYQDYRLRVDPLTDGRTSGPDRLIGSGANDGLYGGPDHDTLTGADGADLLSGETGDDRLYGD